MWTDSAAGDPRPLYSPPHSHTPWHHVKPRIGHRLGPGGGLEPTKLIHNTKCDRLFPVDSHWGPRGVRWLDGITDAKDANLSKLREIVKVRKAWRAAVLGVLKSWTRRRS